MRIFEQLEALGWLKETPGARATDPSLVARQSGRATASMRRGVRTRPSGVAEHTRR